MCVVMNARHVGKRPATDRVYVGRPSKWGNPFVIGRDGSRDQVIAKYRAWIVRQPALMAALHELRGKNLVCWCPQTVQPSSAQHRSPAATARRAAADPLRT
jgi:uncharacterized protein DUF4326